MSDGTDRTPIDYAETQQQIDQNTYILGLTATPPYSRKSRPADLAHLVGDGVFVPLTQKGTASGVASLDVAGKLATAQIPDYLDNIKEYGNRSLFPATGEASKIYVDKQTNLTYRWNGSTYTNLNPGTALGETSTTAYRGDRGKAAYDHSLVTSGNPHNVRYADLPDAPSIPSTGVVTNVTATNVSVAIKTFNTATLHLGEDQTYSVLEMGTDVQLSFLVNGTEQESVSLVSGISVTKTT